jgi:hypothetical protein
MKSFKKWSAEERERSLKLTNQAKRMGLLEEPKQCRCCGQTEGILHTHNKNYDVTLSLVPKMITGTATEDEVRQVKEVLVPICWRCHMIYHSKYRNIAAYERYFAEIKAGKQYPPVYRHDFEILKENGF